VRAVLTGVRSRLKLKEQSETKIKKFNQILTMKKTFLISALMACTLASTHATLYTYTISFSSLGEAIVSPGTGTGTVNYDDITHLLGLNCSFSGLLGNTTASHIHAPTLIPLTGNAGVATTTPSFALFPLGVTSGTFNNILDLTQASSYNPAFVTANGGTTASAEAAFVSAIASGKAYWNIHSSAATGGEIRGFLMPVPEPSSLALVGLFAAAAIGRAWGRKARTANKV
jgi:hypothetical protein